MTKALDDLGELINLNQNDPWAAEEKFSAVKQEYIDALTQLNKDLEARYYPDTHTTTFVNPRGQFQSKLALDLEQDQQISSSGVDPHGLMCQAYASLWVTHYMSPKTLPQGTFSDPVQFKKNILLIGDLPQNHGDVQSAFTSEVISEFDGIWK